MVMRFFILFKMECGGLRQKSDLATAWIATDFRGCLLNVITFYNATKANIHQSLGFKEQIYFF
jgi:hypothetical protein